MIIEAFKIERPLLYDVRSDIYSNVISCFVIYTLIMVMYDKAMMVNHILEQGVI